MNSFTIEIIGGTQRQKKIVTESCGYFADKLFPKYILPELHFDIELIRNLKKKEDIKADCIWGDERVNPRDFEIRIDSSMNMYAIIRALAHEMVHVKQYALGELMDGPSYLKVRWLGKWIKTQNENNYWDRPWEIEAYGKEIGLAQSFISDFKYCNAKWNIDMDYK